MTSRRDILKGMVAGTAGLSGLLPASVQRAYAITPDPGTTYLDAEHVVILMQENRSFDHMFGTLRGVRGFNDPRALRQADGSSIFLQRDQSGAGYLPWRLSLNESRITWMGALPHGRDDQVDAWNGGAHDNWIEAKRHSRAEYRHLPLTLGYHTREDIPFYYALADAFTVCDQNYCSVMSSTTPNRLALWTGTIREPHESGSLVYMRNPQTYPQGLTWTTFPERLQKAGVDWRLYQNDTRCESSLSREEAQWLGNDGDNMLELFASYAVLNTPNYNKVYIQEVVDRALTNIEAREAILRRQLSRAPAKSPEALELEALLLAYADQRSRLARKRMPASIKLEALTAEQRQLRERALTTNIGDPDYRRLETITVGTGADALQMTAPKGDVLHQFREDVRAGRLPTVSWLVAAANFCDHPSRPWYGAWYISEVMRILTENPEVWKKTIFILTYDENDGFFDHAPSFVAADPKRPETGRASRGIDTGEEYSYIEDELIQGEQEKNARSAPIGLGYRVPMIIASSWSRGGWVNSQLSDHTSVIQFLETFIEKKYGKKVVETNISDWRRTVCGDLTSVFRAADDKPARLPLLDRDAHLAAIESARSKPPPAGYRTLSSADIKAAAASPADLRAQLRQEPGLRPACALPYELYVDGAIDRGGGVFQLRMKAGKDDFGARSAGAPFNVYLHGTKRTTRTHLLGPDEPGLMVATYALRAGDEMIEAVDLEAFATDGYDIRVHGPNGFYRHFQGDRGDPQVEASCRYARRNGGAVLLVELVNRSRKACEIVVEDLSYGHRAQHSTITPGESKTLTFDLHRSAQWYDVQMTAKGYPMKKRFAGHVETGRASFSDPVMGAMISAAAVSA